MKKSIVFSILIIVIFLFGCKTQQKATSYNYDDVYSTKTPHATASTQQKVQNEDLSVNHQAVSADTSATLKAASATSGEDYSSNSYSSRIKRFNDKNPGLNYSDPYYSGATDSTSSGGGSSPDVNFFFGNSWGSSYWGYPYSWYDPFFFGYPYSWYSPYYYGYYPYYSFWDYPYYGDGYWYGHHHHYWDWNDGNGRNSYYGQRRSLTNPDGNTTGRNIRSTTGNPKPVIGTGQNTRTLTNTGNTRTTDVTNANTRSTDVINSGKKEQPRVAPDKQRYNYSRGTATNNSRFTGRNGNTRNTTGNTYSQRQQPSPRYVRPVLQQRGSRPSDAQTYTSPSYRQPKSSQEYINPRSQQGRPSGANENNVGTRTYSNPNNYGRRNSPPSNNNGNSRIYSTPSNSGRSYSNPSRSYPSGGSSGRSSGSGYSAPSRSSSAPSHSSGGSSGSGSGSGGGRRR